MSIKRGPINEIESSSVPFGILLPSGSLIFDKSSNIIFELTQSALASDTLDSVTKDIVSGSGDLGDLTDVTITNPTNGQVITYNSSTQEWNNQDIPGGGDMLKSVYDPTNVNGDAFNQDNMNDGITNKNYTDAEKTKLSGIETGATANSTDAFLLDRTNHTGTQSLDTITETATKKVMTKSERDEILLSRGSYITGGVGATINAGTATFNLDVQGIIKDNNILYDIDVQQNNITVTDLTGAVTYVLIDKNGTVIQQKIPATEAQLKNHLCEFVIVHADNTVTNAVNNYILKSDNVVNRLQALGRNIGFINKNGGNIYSANGTNLNINKSAGSVYYPGIDDDDVKSTPGAIALSFRIRNQDGEETANTTTLDVANYDVGGTTTPLPIGTNIFGVYRIFLFPGSNTTVLQRPQFTYSTIEEAINGINTENYQVEENLLTNAVFRGYIVFKKNTTDLSNTNNNRFITPTGSGLGGVVTFTPTLDASYKVSPDPEINVDGSAVSFKGATGTDTDDVLDVKNNAGSITATIQANGVPTKGTDLVTKAFADANYAGGGGGTVTTLDTLEITGTQYTGVVSSYRVGQNGTLAKFSSYLETSNTGSSFIVNLKINGTTVATCTITAGGNSDTTTTFTNSTLTEGDLVTYEISQVGSTVAGADLTIILNLS